MEEAVNKAKNIADGISSIGKLLIAVFVFIFSVGTAWYQIETNASDNIRQDNQFKEVMETMTREFDVMSQRSDKRYQRAMEEAEELHKMDGKLWQKNKDQDSEMLEIIKELYYIKGKLDEADRNK